MNIQQMLTNFQFFCNVKAALSNKVGIPFMSFVLSLTDMRNVNRKFAYSSTCKCHKLNFYMKQLKVPLMQLKVSTYPLRLHRVLHLCKDSLYYTNYKGYNPFFKDKAMTDLFFQQCGICLSNVAIKSSFAISSVKDDFFSIYKGFWSFVSVIYEISGMKGFVDFLYPYDSLGCCKFTRKRHSPQVCQ